MDTAPVLVVEHERSCPPGFVGEWLTAAGVVLDVRRPYAGDALPADLTGHAGLLVLGGAMGANDDADHPWLTATKGLVREAAATAVPTLGICLGHQLAAVALGGRVEPNSRGQQIGLLDIGWTEHAATDALTGPCLGPARGVQWNDDLVVDPPPGAVTLALTPHGEIQALRFADTVWGVQWHPEIGGRITRAWAEEDRDRAAERGVDLDRYVDQVAAAERDLRATWSVLATTYARLVRGEHDLPERKAS